MTAQPMTIGELKASLKRKEPTLPVRYDFVYFHPRDCFSYRGYYDRPAMGYSKDGDDPTVADVLKILDQLTHLEFTGYKGGQYDYNDDQPLYVANYGECGDTMIVDVNEEGGFVRLRTAIVD